MSGVDANGQSIFNLPISCSVTPAGTDESISEFMVSLEDNDPNLGEPYIKLEKVSKRRINVTFHCH